MIFQDTSIFKLEDVDKNSKIINQIKIYKLEGKDKIRKLMVKTSFFGKIQQIIIYPVAFLIRA